MGKRNQYNRSTLPQDMALVIYNPNATVNSDSGTITINPDCGLFVYAGSGATGSINVSGMKNGQLIEIIVAGEGTLLLSTTNGKLLNTSFATASTSQLARPKSYTLYKLDSMVLQSGTESNILVLHSTGSYTGFA